MMRSMQSWAEAHGIRYQAPLPFTVEPVHPPDKVEFDVRCGILGCGSIWKKSEMRVYHLIPGNKIPCCPDCWKGMEFPEEFRDSEEALANLKQ